MKNLIFRTESFLEKVDRLRDQALSVAIKPLWPRFFLPNHLTYSRIAIGIVLFILLFYYKNNDKLLVLSLFCLGALTDLLDGSVARALNKETKLGAMIDPVADRILIIPIAIYSLFGSHRWLFLSIIFLEIINALISIYAHSKNIFVFSNIFGKIKMLLQSVVFAAILVFWPDAPNIYFTSILWISITFMVISIYVKYLEVKNHDFKEDSPR